MAAPRVKLRCDGQWTEARYRSFIKSALRGASKRWGPINKCKQNARVKRGFYKCVGYDRRAHTVPASLPPKAGNKRRINNAVVDHIEPIINPETGFISWDITIERMFVEAEGLQLLCHDCHSRKTAEERNRARMARNNKR